MARADVTPPTTDGSAAAATGCFLSWWWLLAALILFVLVSWILLPWWRARPAPADPLGAPPPAVHPS